MLSLSGKFGGFAGSGFAAAAPKVTASRSLLSCIAPTLSTAIPAHTTRASGQEARASLTATKANVKCTITAVGAAIKQAQREITAACYAAKTSPGQVFPNTQMASSEGELLLSVACQASGLGSLATFDAAGSALSSAAADRSSVSAETEATVRDILCVASQPTSGRAVPADFGCITARNAVAVLPHGTRVDWETTCAQYPDALEAIMHCDPENPSATLFPELAALQNAQ